MKQIELSKTYIIEKKLLKKGAKITVLEESDKFDDMIMDIEGNQITQEEFEAKCSGIISQLEKENLINNGDVIQIKKDVIDYCKVCFNRYYNLPDISLVKNYLLGRNQTFATV
jgi:hypothetical protein